MEDYDPIEMFAGLVGGIVRGSAALQGPAKEKQLMYEDHVRERERLVKDYEAELLRLRRQQVAMWRDALISNPDFTAQVDVVTQELAMKYRDYPMGKCGKCYRRAPVIVSPDFSREHNPWRGAVCAWGCAPGDVIDEVPTVAQLVAQPVEEPTPKKNCLACKHCFCEPDDDFTCGHPDSGPMGLYVKRGPVAHCGNYMKFEQHPMRNPDGSLKSQDGIPLSTLAASDKIK